jgi:N-acetylneuraminic acid mutarotase
MKATFLPVLVLALLLGTAANAAAQTGDVTHNTWTSGAPMPTPLVGSAFGVIKGKIYLVSGATTTAIVGNNEIYDPAKNTWTTGALIPTPRYLPASAVADDVLYVIGGCNSECAVGEGALTVVEAYDPETNSWSEKAPLPTPTDSVYAVAVRNIIYVVGGYVPGSGRVPTLYSYNPLTNTWTKEASMNVGKSNPALGVLGGIIAAGGLGNSGNVTDTEIYNVSRNTWKTIDPIPTAVAGSCFGVISGSLYVAGGAGGSNNDTPVTDLQAYTAKTKTWTAALASLPQAVIAPASAVVRGQLFCIGGSDNGNLFPNTVYADVQIYQP